MPFSPALFSLRRLGLALLVAACAYGWWVTTRFNELNAINQSELASAATELQRAMENAVGTVERYRVPTTATASPAGTGEGPLCAFDRDQPYLDFVGSCDAEVSAFTKPRLSREGGLQVVADRADGTGQVAFRFRVDTLMSELALPDAFDLVFVATDAGTVLYETRPSQQAWRRWLRWGEQAFRDSSTAEIGAHIQDLTALFPADAEPGWGRLRAVTDRTTVQLGGEWHQLYTQPMAGSSTSGTTLVVGGLVPSQQIVRQALSIDTYFAAILILAVLAGALGLPFLKLAALNAHERFRARDVYWLYGSCAALLMVATFTILGIDTYFRWSAEADAGMARMGDDLASRIVGEVDDVRRALVDYDATAAALESPCTAHAPISNWFWQPPGSDALRLFPLRPNLYMRQAAWINPAGQQIGKVTSDVVGKLVSVGTRPYFLAVQAGHVYVRPDDVGRFYVAPDRSITDGKFYTFVAIRSALSDVCGATSTGTHPAQDPFVAVATTRLLSVEHVPLPSGYSFALVNREGRVLYHSDPRLALRENLFDHLAEGQSARAIVYAGTARDLSSQYRARPHRLRFKPLPWLLAPDLLDGSSSTSTGAAGVTLVLMRELSTERAIVARAFVVSLAGPMLVVLVAIVLGLWAAGRLSQHREGHWARWLWPHDGRIPVYRRQALAFGILILACVALGGLTRTTTLLFILPVCTAGAGLAVYRSHTTPVDARRPLLDQRWYMAFFTLLVAGMVLIPAFALFNLTISHEFGTFIRAEQEWMTQRADDAARVLEADIRAEKYPREFGVAVARAHRSRLGEWPYPFSMEPEQLGRVDRGLIRLHESFDSVLPAESALTARLRFLDYPEFYTPGGRLGYLSWFGVCGLVTLMAALLAWIRWSARHLHFADTPSSTPVADSEAATVWSGLTAEQRHVMMQVTQEHIANPRQRPAVLSLLGKGLLRLQPDLQASTPAVEALVDRAHASPESLAAFLAWEGSHEGRSWHQMRLVALVSLGLVAAFLVATQPGLQSELAGIASGVAALGATAMKLRETLVEWLNSRKRK